MRRVLAVVVVLIAAACSSGATKSEACTAWDKFLDEEASGIRTGEEGREAFKSDVYSKASDVEELDEISTRILVAYTDYVEGEGTGEMGDAFRDFSDVCDGRS